MSRTLVVAPLKLTRQEVPEPALEQRHDAAQEEQPHTPPRRPHTDTRALANGPSVEPVVDDVLEILAHADLSHQLVLVPVPLQ